MVRPLTDEVICGPSSSIFERTWLGDSSRKPVSLPNHDFVTSVFAAIGEVPAIRFSVAIPADYGLTDEIRRESGVL
jgi:hypothetical protein